MEAIPRLLRAELDWFGRCVGRHIAGGIRDRRGVSGRRFDKLASRTKDVINFGECSEREIVRSVAEHLADAGLGYAEPLCEIDLLEAALAQRARDAGLHIHN